MVKSNQDYAVLTAMKNQQSTVCTLSTFEMCEQGSNLLSQYLNPLPAKCK
jgi:hypothetical protein